VLVLQAGGHRFARVEVATDELHVRRFVCRVELGKLAPGTGDAEHVEPAQVQQLTSVACPVLVAVVGEQLAAVPAQRLTCRLGVTLGDRVARELFELQGVDGDLGPGKQPDDVVAQHDRVVVAGGLAGEVGGLVQARCAALRQLVRPQQVHHLLAVEPVTRRECEDLDQGGAVAA
jgi:hypothetical protein